jgi:hypothetical protein
MNKKTFMIALIFVNIVLFYSLGMAIGKPSGPPALIWREADSKQILFTSNDILEFDWDKQVCILKYNAMLDFLAWIPPHMHQYRTLSVEDDQGIIYQAKWVSMASSMGFRGPIYDYSIFNPLLSIKNNYPSRQSGTKPEDDIRFSPQLKAGLMQSGVLKSIDTTQSFEAIKIQWSSTEWKNITSDMKLRLECFQNSFQIGQNARAYFYFAGGNQIKKDIDSIAVNIKFTANDGRYVSETTISNIPVSVIDAGIYPCKFDPWQPAAGSDTKPKCGEGFVTLSIQLQKKTGKNIATVSRLDFLQQRVLIDQLANTDFHRSAYKDQINQ